jgi:Tol biopolymer transport system component
MQSPATRIVWRDHERSPAPLIDTPAEYSEPAVSSDDSRVAIGLFDPSLSKRFGYGWGVVSDIWIVDPVTGARSQFTSHPAADWGPVWSPDGRRIIFSSNRRGKLELFERDVSGAEGDERVLPTEGRNPVAQSWSPDGKFVVYTAFDPATSEDLWRLPMSGDRTPVPLVRTKFSEGQGQISPDGRWFAYTSRESGRPEVYVQSFPTPKDPPRRVSTHGGADARWRKDGRQLFYLSLDRQLMALPVQTGPVFEHGAAAAAFDAAVPPFWYEARNLYDVTRDGRFLFMAPAEDDRSMPYTVVVNWLAGRAK